MEAVLMGKDQRRKLRKQISISQVVLTQAHQLMDLHGFTDFSEFLSSLVRDRFERYRAELTAGAISPSPSTASNAAPKPPVPPASPPNPKAGSDSSS